LIVTLLFFNYAAVSWTQCKTPHC